MTSETAVFEVMETDDVNNSDDLLIFAEDQQSDSEFGLDIDLRSHASAIDSHHQRESVSSKKRKTSRIEVVVRKRPLNDKEVENSEMDIAGVDGKTSKVTILEPRLKVDLTKYTQKHSFKFDHAFNEHATNREIYEACVKPLFDTILKATSRDRTAGKATVFGYGQTGSGKTYTLLGSNDALDATGAAVQGLYAMAIADLFKYLPLNNYIVVSFYEIYGGKLYDLLADRKPIICREDGKQKVNIVGIKRIKCDNVDTLMQLINDGNSQRQTGSTGANNSSSRSHAIMSMDILPIQGRLSFIDLAGSERGADTQHNNKQTRLEGAQINISLLALKECIRALDQNSIHKPFRGSKLTQVLKESFVGNSRTLMIANISPSSGSCENTLNTLRYAYRVKELKNGTADTQNSNANANANAPQMSRNRSEPVLPIFGQNHKALSRPTSVASRKQQQRMKQAQNMRRPHLPQHSQQQQRGSLKNHHRFVRHKNKRAQWSTKRNQADLKSRESNHDDETREENEKERHRGGIGNNNNAPMDVDMSENMTTNDQSNKEKKKVETASETAAEKMGKKQLIKEHRRHIDEFMILIKEDMHLLKSFDKDEFGQNEYEQQLKEILEKQCNAVRAYQAKVFKN
eukprot:CAMPEP_0202686804 /NCGR_PEP_ID=MMETSP1385-20130828/2566_1 /ASSEMBLY_ACC=CAM_ASM_000861 /TAXON_ID=933848 /ORGANISM="Elphidium margaritaceum" /LENGTH=628 /DNA_ID=CAMNT_0049341461 /DNA_START=32 /DNA_END=1918 /DNA_ORIENTATION=+